MNNLLQIEIDDLNKIYSVGDTNITAVNSVSLKIEKEELISIVGHSGSGKTTLISIIGGILRPTSGKVLFEGTDICSLNDERLSEYRNKKIGFIFQFASLLPMLTAKENVLLPKIFNSGVGSNIEKTAEEYLEMVGVGDKINSYPSQLSGGQQRRVAIARALIDPEIILADEPTGDLDEETEAEIIELFHRINSEQGVTFVLVTHSSEIARKCKRQYRMSNGVLKED
jgi:putative ABC transport system ATP-binding protein/lipoprotein-releasing system ATP-binding protein